MIRATNKIEYGTLGKEGKNIITVFEIGDEIKGLPEKVLAGFVADKCAVDDSSTDPASIKIAADIETQEKLKAAAEAAAKARA